MVFLKCALVYVIAFAFQIVIIVYGQLPRQSEREYDRDVSEWNANSINKKRFPFDIRRHQKHAVIKVHHPSGLRINGIDFDSSGSIKNGKLQKSIRTYGKKNSARKRRKQKARARATKRKKTQLKKRAKKTKRKHKKNKMVLEAAGFKKIVVKQKMDTYADWRQTTVAVKYQTTRLYNNNNNRKINKKIKNRNKKKKQKKLQKFSRTSRRMVDFTHMAAITMAPIIATTEVLTTEVIPEYQQDAPPTTSVATTTTEVSYADDNYEDSRSPSNDASINSLEYTNAYSEEIAMPQQTEQTITEFEQYDPFSETYVTEESTIAAVTSPFEGRPILKFLCDPSMRPLMRAPVHLISLIGRFNRNKKTDNNAVENKQDETTETSIYQSTEYNYNTEQPLDGDSRATESNENKWTESASPEGGIGEELLITEDTTDAVTAIATEVATFENTLEEQANVTEVITYHEAADTFRLENSLLSSAQFSRENDPDTILLLQETEDEEFSSISTESTAFVTSSLNFDSYHHNPMLANKYSSSRLSRRNYCLPP